MVVISCLLVGEPVETTIHLDDQIFNVCIRRVWSGTRGDSRVDAYEFIDPPDEMFDAILGAGIECEPIRAT